MLSARRTGLALADERGGVLVWVAVMLGTLIIFATFVIDVGNWFEHRRHLQLQADAAVLAGAGGWVFPCNDAGSTKIEGLARDYGGRHDGHLTPSVAPAIYNDQIGGTPPERLHLLVNSLQYWNEGGTNYSDVGRPCLPAGFLDVKITEANLPWFFPLVGSVVPAINAHARVEILQALAISGALPLFVRDVNPKAAAALFIAELSDGSKPLLDAEYLTRQTGPDGAPAPGCPSGVSCWNNAIEVADVAVTDRTSLVVALSSLPRCDPGQTTGCLSLAGTVNQICAQFATECYWADSTTGAVQAGIVYIRGFDTPSVADSEPPKLADVDLSGLDEGVGTCPNGSFIYIESGSCSIRIVADVVIPGNVSDSDVEIRAYGGNCPNNGCTLTNIGGGSFAGLIDIDAAENPPTVPIALGWKIRSASPQNPTVITGYGQCANNWGGGNPCDDTFGPMRQRAFSGSDLYSGPVRRAVVSTAANPGASVSSLPIGAAQLVASIQLAGALATDVSDPAIRLRVVDSSQSAVDCEANVTFRKEMAQGCGPLYGINDRLQAPDPCDPPYGQNQADLFGNTTDVPWDCVAVGPGASVGQFTDGLLGRVFMNGALCTGGGCTNTCPAANNGFAPGRNYWNPTNPVLDPFKFPNFAPGDPRIVTLFMVPFGAFRGQGRALYPVANFGAFYVTGWGGNGNRNDPCPGADPNVPTGWLSGHFIKYTLPSNTGGGGVPCDFNNTTPCVAVLTD